MCNNDLHVQPNGMSRRKSPFQNNGRGRPRRKCCGTVICHTREKRKQILRGFCAWGIQLDHLQLLKPILFWQLSICLTFIVGGQFLLMLKDGFCAAVEGVAGGVVLVDVGEGYSQKAVLFLWIYFSNFSEFFPERETQLDPKKVYQ